jgi:hypothetical protein
MEKFKSLYTKYQQNKISLLDFQLSLEPILGCFEELSKKDEEFIKTTINQIELISTRHLKKYKEEKLRS